jgi:parallel beta-helix repeat protein
MWARNNRPLILGAALLTVAALSVAACDAGSAPASSTTPAGATSTSAATTVATTTTTTTTTTIPTTSVPPSTFAPPELGPTTTAVPTDTTTATDNVPQDAIAVTTDDDLAALVTAAAPGTRFVLFPGVHRIKQVTPKDGMTFEGMPGTVLNGARLVEDFQQAEDGWVATGFNLSTNGHGECIAGYEACALVNDLFVDDQMMWRVDNRDQVAPGKWWSDGSQIVMGDNPVGRKVEVSVTEHAFLSDAADVTIQNLVVEKFATIAQGGAIQAQLPGLGARGTDWLIENVETRLNHAAGIRAGDGTMIRNVHSHHNGQEGITGNGDGITVESSEIDHNNLRGFNWGWEAAGAKFTTTTRLVLRDLEVHDNKGPGLWADIGCRDTTFENNVVYGNDAPGIFYEISFDAVISGNEVYDNGFIMGDWLWGAGILVAASSGVDVFDNVVTNNADGIAGIQQDREDNGELYRLENLSVHDNTITMWYGQTGVVQDMGDPSVFTDRNIVFENNSYVGAGHKAFAWNDQDLDWAGWQATGQGRGSTIGNG